MIGFVLALQIAGGGLTPQSTKPLSLSVPLATTSSSVRAIKTVLPGEIAILSAPPCAQPTTWQLARIDCTEWAVQQPITAWMSDGRLGPVDAPSVIPAPAGGHGVIAAHGAQYLNIGHGLALLMSGGRCSYSTGWHGKLYADQDFVGADGLTGGGVGRPKKGAKPCR